jgi:hypothetical protein
MGRDKFIPAFLVKKLGGHFVEKIGSHLAKKNGSFRVK